MLNGQRVLPAISSHKALKTFLKTDLDYCLIMSFQLAQLSDLIKIIKKHNKRVIIHLELIKGLCNDEYGAIYLIQELKVDGIISTKPKVIELCKKRQVIGIMRFFLKDTLSLDQSLKILSVANPEAIEVLPAMPDKLDIIRKHSNSEILTGGLITKASEVKACLDAGAQAITTSKEDLWHHQH